jgi:hypothetical protein
MSTYRHREVFMDVRFLSDIEVTLREASLADLAKLDKFFPTVSFKDIKQVRFGASGEPKKNLVFECVLSVTPLQYKQFSELMTLLLSEG